MLEHRSDLWILAHELNADAVAITTNGFVKRNGQAVMGRGCALEAALRFPELAAHYGRILNDYPLQVVNLTPTFLPGVRLWGLKYHLVAFPVKPAQVNVKEDRSNIIPRQRMHFSYRNIAPGWAAMADINLIAKSAGELMDLIVREGWGVVLLPRPGCGNGGLSWEREVRNILSPILDDRVVIVSK